MKQGKANTEINSPRWGLRWFLLSVCIIGALIAIAARPMIIIRELKSGSFLFSSYTFKEEDFHHPRLLELRRREKLDQVVAPGQTQFEKIVLLRHWAHEQWLAGGDFYYPPWDAVEILDLARRAHNKAFCAQYAIVFAQACQSLGLHARYVELTSHFLTGVWSDDFNRWMIMDPTNDIYYERDGLPMRGGELNAAVWSGKTRGIVKVEVNGKRTPVELADLEPYRMYSIITTADQLTHPPSVRVNDQAFHPLVHESDYRRYPLIGRDKLVIASQYLGWDNGRQAKHFLDKPMSGDPDDFSYAMDQTLLFVARRNPQKGILKIVLYAENSPTEEGFLYQLNGGSWQFTNLKEMVWPLIPGKNSLAARIKTKFGWEGPISEIVVYYKPPWFGLGGDKQPKISIPHG